MSTDSVNHVGYEGLRARPIAVWIETKTKSRTVEEAKVQLGVWVAAQVARIEALVRQLASLGVKKPAAEACSDRLESEMVTRGRRKYRGRGGRMSLADRPQAQESIPSPTVVTVPNPSDILSQTVFPLIDIQSEAWSLFFARVIPSNTLHPSKSDIRKPVSNIQNLPFGSLGKHGKHSAAISAGQKLKGTDITIRLIERLNKDDVRCTSDNSTHKPSPGPYLVLRKYQPSILLGMMLIGWTSCFSLS